MTDKRHTNVGGGPFVPANEVPDFVAVRDHIVDELVRFTRALRRAGAEVPANATLTAAQALVEVGFKEDFARAALRAALITRQEDLDKFDRMFPEFWRRLTAGLELMGPAERPDEDAPEGGFALHSSNEAPGNIPEGEAESELDELDAVGMKSVASVSTDRGGDAEHDSEAVTTSTYSPTGPPSPVAVDPAVLVAHEDLDAALRQLTRAIAALEGRRWTRGGDERMDTRRALRESFGTGGTIVSVPRKEYKLTAVQCVMLVDVSQSVLDTIDRGFLINFLRAVDERWRHIRVFFFDDQVREVTTQLDAPTAQDALAALERAETGWGGGTRIGHSIETVRREYPSAVDRKTVFVMISDGLEIGEIEQLERGMAWLSRRATAVLWLNPLAASSEYEPECRGMAASLPYVDGLFAFTSPDDIAEMARQLRLRGTSGEVGYKQDPRRRKI